MHVSQHATHFLLTPLFQKKKQEDAHEESQKYKIGKYIFEKAKIRRDNGWDSSSSIISATNSDNESSTTGNNNNNTQQQQQLTQQQQQLQQLASLRGLPLQVQQQLSRFIANQPAVTSNRADEDSEDSDSGGD